VNGRFILQTLLKNRRFIRLLTITVILAFVIACTLTTSSQSSIVGRWWRVPATIVSPYEKPTPWTQKGSLGTPEATAPVAIDSCVLAYPSMIEFFADDTYTGQSDKVWSGGEYEILDNGSLKLSTAEGSLSVYEYSLSGDILTINAKDTPACELRYERAKDSLKNNLAG
jgi:hypothetical protein